MSLEVKKITSPDVVNINTITNWMYNWWGSEEGYSHEEVKCYIEHSFQESRLPQTYGLYLDNILIGIYQFTNSDLFCRPDIYPWLTNLYIDEKYRDRGYGRILIESVKKNAQKSLSEDTLYLFTKHMGLYEKYGWEYVCDIDSFGKKKTIEKLYELKL